MELQDPLVWEKVGQGDTAWALVRVWTLENKGRTHPMQSGWLAHVRQGDDGIWHWQSELRVFGQAETLDAAQQAARAYVELRGSGRMLQKGPSGH
jgi:hypothetical protein